MAVAALKSSPSAPRSCIVPFCHRKACHSPSVLSDWPTTWPASLMRECPAAAAPQAAEVLERAVRPEEGPGPLVGIVVADDLALVVDVGGEAGPDAEAGGGPPQRGRLGVVAVGARSGSVGWWSVLARRETGADGEENREGSVPEHEASWLERQEEMFAERDQVTSSDPSHHRQGSAFSILQP